MSSNRVPPKGYKLKEEYIALSDDFDGMTIESAINLLGNYLQRTDLQHPRIKIDSYGGGVYVTGFRPMTEKEVARAEVKAKASKESRQRADERKKKKDLSELARLVKLYPEAIEQTKDI